MENTNFPVSDLNQVRRIPNRGAYDHETVHSVIDAAHIGHLAFPSGDADFSTVIIPMLHVRRDSQLFFHGAQTSRLMQFLASGQPVTISFAMVDGLVLAKSLFHHSMNYRSALVFGRGKELTGDAERLAALECFAEKLLPGRWREARLPNAQEMKATKIVAVEIETASAKIRTGGPKDDAEDESLPIWSGVVPCAITWGAPQADSNSQHLPLPNSMTRRYEATNAPE
jgi:uncharacterized protein